MRRLIGIIVTVGMLLLSLMTVPSNVSAEETSISIDYPVTDGIEASFSFYMNYNPDMATVLSGESINLVLSPEPNTVEVNLNIEDLLIANGFTVPIEFASYLQDDIVLPITRTPIGTETIYSYVISVATGLAIVVDANIIGEIEASLTNEGGLLSDSQLTWNNWGGKEVTLDTLDDENITVSANFTYDVSLSFALNFTVGGVSLYNYDIPSVDLGEVQFPQTIVQTVSTVLPYGVGYDDGYLDGYDVGFYDGNISSLENITIDPDDEIFEEVYDEGYWDGYDVGYDEAWDEIEYEEEVDGEGLPSIGLLSTVVTVAVLGLIMRFKGNKN